MKAKLFLIVLMSLLSINTKAEIHEIEINTRLEHNSLPTVRVEKISKVQVCNSGAPQNRVEKIALVALQSAFLSKSYQVNTFIVGSPVSNFDAGFNHWRYACAPEERVTVNEVRSVSFVIINKDIKKIYIELPYGFTKNNVSVSSVPQPVH